MFGGPVSTVGPDHSAIVRKEEAFSYELKAVFFADGTFYGPDEVLADFSKQINMARSMARDTQHLDSLKQYEFAKAMREAKTTSSTIFKHWQIGLLWPK